MMQLSFVRSFSFLSVIILVRVSLIRAEASSGEWRPQLGRPVSQWQSLNVSFDTRGNWAHCLKFVIDLPLISRISDYAPAINSALETAANIGGGSVRLGAGLYPIGTNIVMPSYTCLIGAGIDRTVIRVNDGINNLENRAGYIRSRLAERVTAHGFTLDGNHVNQKMTTASLRYGRFGLYFELVNYVWFKNVRIRNCGGYGFDPHGNKKLWAYYLAIEKCIAEGNLLDGFALDQTRYISIVGSQASNNGRHGINVITGSRDVLVRGNKLYNNGGSTKVGCGITVQNNHELGTRTAIISDNEVKEAYRAGVCLRNVHEISVDNTVIANGKVPSSNCYELFNSTAVTIRHTKCNILSKDIFRPRSSPSTAPVTAAPTPATNSGSSASGSGGDTCKSGSGIRDKTACCPKRCKQCGGSGCGIRGKAGECCSKAILSSGKQCADHSPPCIL